MDARTEELRDAHDMLAKWYAKNMIGVLASKPVERAMLELFAETTLAVGTDVAEVGCRTGRVLPYLADRDLSPRGGYLAWDDRDGAAGAPGLHVRGRRPA